MNLHATEIVIDFRGGSSLPVLVKADDNKNYVVKWKGTAEGAIASATDWLALNLAPLFGVPVPQATLITIDEELCHKHLDAEVKDLVLWSVGTNLAIEYMSNATPYTKSDFSKTDEKLRNKIYLFDVLLLNIDRVDVNPNMFYSNTNLICIDFSASMAIKGLLGGNDISESVLLPRIRQHPFFAESVDINSFHFKIDDDTSRRIVETIPDEWLAEIDADTSLIRTRACKGITELINNRMSILQIRQSELGLIPFQHPDESRNLRQRNRDNFLSKFGFRLYER